MREKYKKQCPWVKVYYHIDSRCNNTRDDSYDMYGAKGIKNFLTKEDVKFLWERDKANLLKKPSIDRKDSKKDYYVENCCFIELVENSKKSWFNRKDFVRVGRRWRRKQEER